MALIGTALVRKLPRVEIRGPVDVTRCGKWQQLPMQLTNVKADKALVGILYSGGPAHHR